MRWDKEGRREEGKAENRERDKERTLLHIWDLGWILKLLRQIHLNKIEGNRGSLMYMTLSSGRSRGDSGEGPSGLQRFSLCNTTNTFLCLLTCHLVTAGLGVSRKLVFGLQGGLLPTMPQHHQPGGVLGPLLHPTGPTEVHAGLAAYQIPLSL